MRNKRRRTISDEVSALIGRLSSIRDHLHEHVVVEEKIQDLENRLAEARRMHDVSEHQIADLGRSIVANIDRLCTSTSSEELESCVEEAGLAEFMKGRRNNSLCEVLREVKERIQSCRRDVDSYAFHPDGWPLDEFIHDLRILEDVLLQRENQKKSRLGEKVPVR